MSQRLMPFFFGKVRGNKIWFFAREFTVFIASTPWPACSWSKISTGNFTLNFYGDAGVKI
jgi:hypothetical protein